MSFFPSFGRKDSNPVDMEFKDAATRRASAGRGYAYVGQPYTPPGADIERLVKDGYEKVIWAFKAVDAIAEKMSSWPLQVVEGSGTDAKTVEDAILPLLNEYSNEIERAAKWMRYRLVSQLLLSKRGVFIEVIPKRAGGIAALNLLPPGMTTPIPDPDKFLSGFRVELPGDQQRVDLPVYDPERGGRGVVWIRKPHPTDPYASVTPLEAAGISLDLDFYARMYNRNFLLNDGRAGQLVAVKGGLSPEDAQELKARFSPGIGKAGQTTIIEADSVSVQDTAVSPRDAQYAELRDITKNDILIALGTPESVIGNASGRTFDNADAEKENWLDVTVLPLAGVVEAGFDALTEGGYGDNRRVKHDVSGEPVLRRAHERRVQKAREDVAAGLITIDEFREVAERDPMRRPASRVLWFPASSKIAVGDEKDEGPAAGYKPVGGPPSGPVDGSGGADSSLAGFDAELESLLSGGATGTPQGQAQAFTTAGADLGMETKDFDLALEEKAFNPKQPRYPMNHPLGGKFMDTGDVALWLAGKPLKGGHPSAGVDNPNSDSTASPASAPGAAGGTARFTNHPDPKVAAAAALVTFPAGYPYARALGAPPATITPRGNGFTKLLSLRKGDVVNYSGAAAAGKTGPWTVASQKRLRSGDVELELVNDDGDVVSLTAGGQQTMSTVARTPHPSNVAAAKATIAAAARAMAAGGGQPPAAAPAPASARTSAASSGTQGAAGAGGPKVGDIGPFTKSVPGSFSRRAAGTGNTMVLDVHADGSGTLSVRLPSGAPSATKPRTLSASEVDDRLVRNVGGYDWRLDSLTVPPKPAQPAPQTTAGAAPSSAAVTPQGAPPAAATPAPAPPATAPTPQAPPSPAAAVIAKGVEKVHVGTGWQAQAGSQAGSNPASMMTAPDGTKHYVKSQDAEHADNEVTAARIYAAAGVLVPTVRRATLNPGQFTGQRHNDGIASEVVAGDAQMSSRMASNASFRDAVLEDFAVHAWLGNWDAVENDNTMVATNGRPLTVDVGGSLVFRARGDRRVLGDKVEELQSMRDRRAGGTARATFSQVTPDHTDARFVAGVERIAAISPEQIKELVDQGMGSFSARERADLVDKLVKRREHLAQVARVDLPEKKKPAAAAAAPAPAAPQAAVSAAAAAAQARLTGAGFNDWRDVLVLPVAYPWPKAPDAPVASALAAPKPIKARSLRKGDVIDLGGLILTVTRDGRPGRDIDVVDSAGNSLTVAQSGFGPGDTLMAVARTPHPQVTAAARTLRSQQGNTAAPAPAAAPAAPAPTPAGAAPAAPTVAVGTTGPFPRGPQAPGVYQHATGAQTLVVDATGAGVIHFPATSSVRTPRQLSASQVQTALTSGMGRSYTYTSTGSTPTFAPTFAAGRPLTGANPQSFAALANVATSGLPDAPISALQAADLADNAKSNNATPAGKTGSPLPGVYATSAGVVAVVAADGSMLHFAPNSNGVQRPIHQSPSATAQWFRATGNSLYRVATSPTHAQTLAAALPSSAQVATPAPAAAPSFPGVTMLPQPQTGTSSRSLVRGDIIQWQGTTYEVQSVDAATGDLTLASPSGASAPFAVTAAQIPNGVTLLGRPVGRPGVPTPPGVQTPGSTAGPFTAADIVPGRVFRMRQSGSLIVVEPNGDGTVYAPPGSTNAGQSSSLPAAAVVAMLAGSTAAAAFDLEPDNSPSITALGLVLPQGQTPSSLGGTGAAPNGAVASFARHQYSVPTILPVAPITSDEARAIAAARKAAGGQRATVLQPGHVYTSEQGGRLVVAMDGTAIFYPWGPNAQPRWMSRGDASNWLASAAPAGTDVYDLGGPSDARAEAAGQNVTVPAAPAAPNAPAAPAAPAAPNAPNAPAAPAGNAPSAADIAAAQTRLAGAGINDWRDVLEAPAGYPYPTTPDAPVATTLAAPKLIKTRSLRKGDVVDFRGTRYTVTRDGRPGAGLDVVDANGVAQTIAPRDFTGPNTDSMFTVARTPHPQITAAARVLRRANAAGNSPAPSGTPAPAAAPVAGPAPAPAGTPTPPPALRTTPAVTPGTQAAAAAQNVGTPQAGGYDPVFGQTYAAAGTGDVLVIHDDGTGQVFRGRAGSGVTLSSADVQRMLAAGTSYVPVGPQMTTPRFSIDVGLHADANGDRLVVNHDGTGILYQAGSPMTFLSDVEVNSRVNARGGTWAFQGPAPQGTPPVQPATPAPAAGSVPPVQGINPATATNLQQPTVTFQPTTGTAFTSWIQNNRLQPGQKFTVAKTGNTIEVQPDGSLLWTAGPKSRAATRSKVVTMTPLMNANNGYVASSGPDIDTPGTKHAAEVRKAARSIPLPPPGTPIAGTPPRGAVYPTAATGVVSQTPIGDLSRGQTLRFGGDDWIITEVLDAGGPNQQVWGFRPGVDDPNTLTQDAGSLKWHQGARIPVPAGTATVETVAPPVKRAVVPANGAARPYDDALGSIATTTGVGSDHGSGVAVQTQEVDANTLKAGDVIVWRGHESEGQFVITKIGQDHKGREAVFGYNGTLADLQGGAPLPEQQLFLCNPRGNAMRKAPVVVDGAPEPIPVVPKPLPPAGPSQIERNDISDPSSAARVKAILNSPPPTLGKAPNATLAGDTIAAHLMEMRGYNALPDVVSEQEMDDYVDAGEIEVFRGMAPDPNRHPPAPLDLVEAYRSGDHYPGGDSAAMFGVGPYAVYGQEKDATNNSRSSGWRSTAFNGSGSETAESFSKGYGRQYRRGQVMRMTVKADARVADYDALLAAYHADNNPDLRQIKRLGDKGVGHYAVLMGYDVIKVRNAYRHAPGGTKGEDDWNAGFVVILNRSAMRVSEKNYVADASSEVGPNPPPLQFSDIKHRMDSTKARHEGGVDTTIVGAP